jgi:hypothetical protein
MRAAVTATLRRRHALSPPHRYRLITDFAEAIEARPPFYFYSQALSSLAHYANESCQRRREQPGRTRQDSEAAITATTMLRPWSLFMAQL